MEPPDGVGPLRLGMTVEQARSALATLGEISGSASGGLYADRSSGLGFSVGLGIGGRVNAVEVYRPAEVDVVRYRDVDVFGLPAQEVVQQLGRHTRVVEDEDQEGCFRAPELLLAFWRPFVADDDPDDAQGYYFGSVLVARPGYYDTPAEAAARLASGGLPGY